MAVLNVHDRPLSGSLERAGALIDTLAGPDDRLWPGAQWPAMRLDLPLCVGARGGHGPIRYVVSHYVPGQWVRFQFTSPQGFHGFHEYAMHLGDNGGPVLRHTLAIRPRGWSRFAWPLAYRWLHDAVIEDSLDGAERARGGAVAGPRQWGCYVRLLRRLLSRLD